MESSKDKKSFIKSRLDSLDTIDGNVVALLDQMSGIFGSLSSPSNNNDDAKTTIQAQTKTIYRTISDIAINLRKEVKIMDDNIGVFDRNDDNVMILPIPVEQKTTELGRRRLKEEISHLDSLIPEEPSEDQKFHSDKDTGAEASVDLMDTDKEQKVADNGTDEKNNLEEQNEDKEDKNKDQEHNEDKSKMDEESAKVSEDKQDILDVEMKD